MVIQIRAYNTVKGLPTAQSGMLDFFLIVREGPKGSSFFASWLQDMGDLAHYNDEPSIFFHNVCIP